jgi:hypothetical protein
VTDPAGNIAQRSANDSRRISRQRSRGTTGG